MNAYMVTWRYGGVTRMIDFNTEGGALGAAVAMAEVGNGRTEIHVSAVPYEETEEDKERKARIWERIKERIDSDVIPRVFA